MAFQFAQLIHDEKLNESYRGLLGRIKSRILNSIFSRLKIDNPLIEITVGKFRIQVPFSHELPFILKRSPYYSTNLARIAKLVHYKYPELTFVDVGANVGDSVALLRTEATFPILCIEGDSYFFSILETNAYAFSNVKLVKNFVGESVTKITATSVESGGTAHLSHDETKEGEKIDIKTLSAILKDNPSFQQSKMIKIDTDGFDNKIIKGSIDFLNNSRPVIFFEYDPFFLSRQNDDGLSIFSILATNGYQKLLIYENHGELMLSADLNNSILLEDITHFYTGRKGLQYCDICVFHTEDIDLFENVRKSEIEFFTRSRN